MIYLKRNLDLLRLLLLEIENIDDISFDSRRLTHLSEPITVYYHIHLLYEVGFIEALPYSSNTCPIPMYRILWITNAGHDYIDSIRNNTVWSKTKSLLSSSGTNFALHVVQDIATKVLLSSLHI